MVTPGLPPCYLPFASDGTGTPYGHAEQVGGRWLVNSGVPVPWVTAVFTALSPCTQQITGPFNCTDFLNEVFPGIRIYSAYAYPSEVPLYWSTYFTFGSPRFGRLNPGFKQ